MIKRLPVIFLCCFAAVPLRLGAEDLVIKEGLVLRLPRTVQRSAFAVDPVEMMMAARTWKAPKPGDAVAFSATENAKWDKIAADANGWFATPGDSYVDARISSARARVMILNGFGDSYVFANGELRMGGKYAVKDAYESWEPRFDYGQVPVLLKKGENHFLFRASRGRLKAVLSSPAAPVIVNDKDVTLPDLIVAERTEAWGAIVVMNGTSEPRKNLIIETSGEGLESAMTDVGLIQPMSVRKAAFLIKGEAPSQPARIQLKIVLKDKAAVQTELQNATVALDIKSPLQNHKRTFRSGIDGSVQYYAVNPAQARSPEFKPALVLSVHGAGVEAVNQAGSYESKSWANIIAPTNRRPYGFDWEDWGRIDALEAMADFKRRYPVDPERVYLTGHSMGGHGAWILGVQFPDLFAAVGPSAGWISFRTYSSRQRDEGSTGIEKLASRPLIQGDTLAFVRNTLNFGVYILHGEKDESVPVAQARQMAQTLAEFHKDFIYHEEKDAQHWWDKSDEPGTDCVDYAPMFDFFGRHSLPRPENVREVEFATVNPGLSCQCRWARIEAQIVPLKLSSVHILVDPGMKRFSGTTDNVARLALELSALGQSDAVVIRLDGQELKTVPKGSTLWLYRNDSTWTVGDEPSPALKGPRRSGPFKDAFRNRMIFVYGTKGAAEENAWAFEKARFDAECFQYQGNGSVEVRADRDFDPASEPDRSVILYGNAVTNGAWKPLLGDSPVQVNKDFIAAGGRRIVGKDLACLFLRPRPKSASACVGVVSGTGILGMRLTNTRSYLYAGYALPDLVVFDSGVAKGGGEGVRLAGFFGLDWSLDGGEFLWAEPSPPSAKTRHPIP
jgi:poly(3-hydroxybutyrate) depolymerase